MKKTTVLTLLAFFVIAITLTGCADVSHVDKCLSPGEHTYGFWGGLWHGFVAGFAFIGSLFSDDIAVYAINNNGGWYDFGFLFGVGVFTGGSSRASK